MKLSVVLAVRNEEENIARCLNSVKDIADEIIVVDEYSIDRTKQIAESFLAKVYEEPHHDIFHITKQRAIDRAKHDWILQLDADEVVTPELAKEINDLVKHGVKPGKPKDLFLRHQRLITAFKNTPRYNRGDELNADMSSSFGRENRGLRPAEDVIEERDGKIGKESDEIAGYFIPRKNMFLGKPLIHAGVYPDGVIRLVKKGKARFPQKSVHEQIELDGKVGWLSNDLEHYDSPTLKRYFTRLNRYTDLHASELRERHAPRNVFYFIYYSLFKSFYVFLNLFFFHKGFLDGVNGFLWSFFSSLHYPIAYFKYLTAKNDS